MKSPELYRRMEELYRFLRWRMRSFESHFANSEKWRERGKLEIESYLRVLYEIPGTTVH